MSHPQNIALVWIQSGKSQLFKIVHDLLFLLGRDLVIWVP